MHDRELVMILSDDLLEALQQTALDFETTPEFLAEASVRFMLQQGHGIISGAIFDASEDEEEEEVDDFN